MLFFMNFYDKFSLTKSSGPIRHAVLLTAPILPVSVCVTQILVGRGSGYSNFPPTPGQSRPPPLRYSSMRFLAPGFFHESTPFGSLIHTLKHYQILVQILGDIQISKLFCGVSDSAEHKKYFQIGGSLSMDPICLG